MTRRPLVALAAGFALGIALPPLFLVPAAAAVAIPLALSPPLAPLGFAAAGWVAAALTRAGAPAGPPRETRRLEGVVVSVPDRLGDRVRFVLRTSQGQLVQATARQLPWPLALGDAVTFEARLREPEPLRNPGGRDRAAELAARGIAVEALATSGLVRVAPPGWPATLESARDRFAGAAGATLPAREAGLVRAVATGDRAGVDAATTDAFARSGLAHLLSVSGLHLAVVALGAFRLLRAALSRLDGLAARLDPRRLAAALCLPLTALYALATGAQVPVVRSAIAAAIGFSGILLARPVDALNVLALAALAILAIDPGALLDVSFQLSFASVAGLALASAPLRRALPVPRRATSALGRLQEALLGALCASAAATVATLPIVAAHFRRISVVGVAANVVGVPIGSALTVLAAVAAAVHELSGWAGEWLLRACHPVATLLLAVNDAAAALPWGSLGVGSPGAAGVALCYAALLAAWGLRGTWRVVAIPLVCVALLAPPHLRHLLALRRGGLEVTFLSVGQGDSTAFLLPDGSAVLVDGGGEAQGRYDPGARDILPWLLDTGVSRIAAVFVSHPHPDHLLGLPAVAAALPVEHLFTTGRTGDELTAAAFARLPRAERFVAGDRFERAGVRFEALAPARAPPEWTENDASMVLRVSHGAVTVLMCGDIEAEGEAALIEGTPPGRLRADVVKIPHHGSATSSGEALVTAVRPAFAVASVGHDNRFGFPDAGVVARWRAAGAQVLRTDGGAIRFLSDGRSLHRTPAAASLDVMALAREGL